MEQPIENRPIELQDKNRIQFAHDLLQLTIDGKIPVPPALSLNPFAMSAVVTIKDVLCWVLKHPNGQHLEALLNDAEKYATDHGTEFHRMTGGEHE